MRELALHILDLVQNSIEAQATKVWLNIIECIETDLLTIKIVDNGRGMDRDTVNTVLDPFVTTRKTRRIGLGLPLIDMSASRCGGALDIQSQPGKGTTVTATYIHSHLDRPPLGDIAATVKTILVANPDLDFNYCHTVEKRNFSVATKELTEILGDIPLSQPEVLNWLQDYLSQGISNLYGGANSENS